MRRPSDLQIYYQRNHLIAILLMTACFILASLYLFTLSTSVQKVNLNMFIPHENDLSSSKGKTEEIKAVKNIPLYNPYAGSHQGFLGFVNLEIINDQPMPVGFSLPVYTFDNPQDFINDFPVSFSILDGSDTGVYVTSDGNNNMYYEYNNQPHAQFNREIQVLRDTEPEYPWVAKESGKEGEISVLIYIDSLGNIAPFPYWITGGGVKSITYINHGKKQYGNYVVTEEYEGWFFAKKFIDVLPDWKFSPRIQNSVPISSFLKIKYTFCLTTKCSNYALEQMLDIH